MDEEMDMFFFFFRRYYFSDRFLFYYDDLDFLFLDFIGRFFSNMIRFLRYIVLSSLFLYGVFRGMRGMLRLSFLFYYIRRYF